MRVERDCATDSILRGLVTAWSSGKRVSNTWATCPEDGDNSGKLLLIPDMLVAAHAVTRKGFGHFGIGPRLISLLVR